jgi:predicted glutamine amidotransferase
MNKTTTLVLLTIILLPVTLANTITINTTFDQDTTILLDITELTSLTITGSHEGEESNITLVTKEEDKRVVGVQGTITFQDVCAQTCNIQPTNTTTIQLEVKGKLHIQSITYTTQQQTLTTQEELIIRTLSTTKTIDNFTTSDTWTAPVGIEWAYVEVWGGGGGGATPSGNGVATGGGGGGAYSASNLTSITPGVYTITVGSAGGSGTSGGDSWFSTSTTVMAKGGGGGVANTGGTGGAAASGHGTTKYSGGDGSNGIDSTATGAGGGGAGSTGDGGNASGTTGGSGTSELGGNGGNGVTAAGAGGTGNNYGGGGGGAWRQGGTQPSGPSGAGGYVRITYVVSNETTPPTYSNVSVSTKTRGFDATFSILWDDNNRLQSAGEWIFSTNNTGTWINDSAVGFTSTPSWANVTKTLNDTVGVKIGYRWYATDNLNNSNSTEIFTLVTEPDANISQTAYRFYNEGTESGSSPSTNQNTGLTLGTTEGDVNLQLRIRLQEVDDANASSSDDYQLQYAINESTYANILGTKGLSFLDESSSYGGPINDILVSGDYIYAGGNYNNSIKKFNKSSLTLVDSVDFGVDISNLFNDDEYIYVGSIGLSTYIGKHHLSNLSYVDQTANLDFVGVGDLVVDENYVYWGTRFAGYTIRRYDKTDMTYVSQSPSYGGDILALAINGDYIYAGGDTNQSVVRYNISDLSFVDESPSYGGTIRSIVVSGDYIYAGGDTNQSVVRYNISDLSFVDASPNYGGTINSVVVNGDYVYAGGATTERVRRYNISDLSFVDESPSYGGTIRSIVVSGDYIYAGGSTTERVRRYNTIQPSIIAFNSSSLTDGSATTQRLTGGSGGFNAGKVSETGLAENVYIGASNFTELLFSLNLNTSKFSDGDTIDFRVLRNNEILESYSVTPRITISNNTNLPLYSKFNGSTTNFSAESNLSNVNAAILEITSYGRIIWNNAINATSQDFDSYVFIEDNLIGIDPTNLDSTLNTSANLSFYNLTWGEAQVLRNGVLCESPQCNITGYASGTLNVTVDGFSNYSTQESSIIDISTCEELQNMSNNLSADYILVNDIDCSETTGWNSGQGFIAVGNSVNNFTGSLDGQGFEVRNLYINRVVSYQGLFGIVGETGEVRNIGLTNVSITTNRWSGLLAGQNYGYIENVYSTGTITGDSDQGGIVGWNRVGGVVNNTYSHANVTGTNWVGGLVGDNQGTIINSYSTGYVTGTGESVGGLSGTTGTHSNSFWNTQTSGQSTSGAGTGKTTAEMKTIFTYNDTATTGLSTPWDISLLHEHDSELWFIYDRHDYPKLYFEKDDIDQLFWSAENYDVDEVPTFAWLDEESIGMSIQQDEEGYKYLSINDSGGSRSHVRFLPARNESADVEIWIRWFGNSSDQDTQTYVRGSSDMGPSTGNWLRFNMRGPGLDHGLARHVSGTYAAFVEDAVVATSGAISRHRGYVNDTNMSASWWYENITEPSNWYLTTTQTAVEEPGKIGVTIWRDIDFRVYQFSVGINGAAAPSIPEMPGEINFTSTTSTTTTFEWSSALHADSYVVFRANDSSGEPGTFTEIATTANTNYTDNSLSSNTMYWYKVRGNNEWDLGPYGESYNVTTEESAESVNISFVSPTPANDTTIPIDNTLINVSINVSDLQNFKWNWNGTNFSLYDDSLVLLMDFDNVSALGENSTYFVDTSVYDRYASCSGTSCPVVSSSGRYGSALDFDGSNDTVNTSDFNSTNGLSELSVCMWLNPDSRTSLAGVVRHEEGATTAWKVYLGGTNTLIALQVGSVWVSTLNSILALSEWQHHCFVYNGSIVGNIERVEIYKNGELEDKTKGTGTVPASIPTVNASLLIGEHAGAYWDGRIDQLQVFSRALSQQEVQQIYKSNLNKYDENNWQFVTNQTNLSEGTYTYYAYANSSSNENQTETRTLTYSLADDPLNISFTSPTPANASTITDNFTTINVSINTTDLQNFKFNWNGTNTSFYDEDLVLMYNFDNVSALGENNSFVRDLSSSSYNATITSATLTNGVYGSAYDFDGSGDYISAVGDNLNPYTDNFTVSLWLKVQNADAFFISKGHRLTTISGWAINYWNNGVDDILYARVSEGATDKRAGVRTINPPQNEWIHITMVVDREADEVRGYLNANSSYFEPSGNGISLENISNISSSEPLLIGASSDFLSANYLNGSIDEVRIWRRALSQQEIQQLYKSNLNKYDENNWQFVTNQTNLSEGTYTYYAYANSSSNENQTEIRTLFYDGDPPITSIDMMTSTLFNYQNNSLTNRDVNITLSCTDLIAGCNTTVYCIDSSNSCNPTIVYTEPFTVSSQGTNYVRFRSNDTIGNLEEINYAVILIDKTKPIVTLEEPTTPNQTILYTNPLLLNLSYDDENDVSIAISVGDSLVSWWTMNNVTGNIVIDEMNRNNLTIMGEMQNISQGRFGQSLRNPTFNASNYLRAGHSSSLAFGTESFTIAGWFNHTKLGASSLFAGVKKSLLCYVDSAGFDIGHVYSSTSIDYCFNDGTNKVYEYVELDAGYQPGDFLNQSVFVVYVVNRDEKTVITYINGVRQTNELNITNITGSLTSSEPLRIGSMYARPLTGSVDNIMIYNRALNDDEVELLNVSTTPGNKYLEILYNKKGVHNFSVYSLDLAGNLNRTETRTLTVAGNLVMNSSRIDPATKVVSIYDLKGYCRADSENSDNLTYEYEWYRNGSTYHNGTTSETAPNLEIRVDVLPSTNTTAGEEWILGCRATDGTQTTDWLNSTTITIESHTNISTCTELQDIGESGSQNYVITNNIDCSDTINWNSGLGFNPLTQNNPYFIGLLEGQGHYIDDLYINRPSTSTVGMLGRIYAGGEVRNIKLRNINVTGNGNVGGLVGYSRGSITSCYVSGYVSHDSSSGLGGVVGGLDNTGSISECKADVYVKSDDLRSGGIAGTSGGDGVIKNSYSLNEIDGFDERHAGIAGQISSNSNLSKVYSYAKVTSGFNNGGVVGEKIGSTVENAFWDQNISYFSSAKGGTGKTTQELWNITTYNDTTTTGLDEAWDIVHYNDFDPENPTTWFIYDGHDYPRLHWEYNDYFYVEECMELNQTGTYIVVNNLTSTGTCLDITAPNVELQCRGHTITYSTSSTGYGININNNSAIVQNCDIKQGSTSSNSHAIYVRTGNDAATISNTNIITNGTFSVGVYIYSYSMYHNINNLDIHTYGSSAHGIGTRAGEKNVNNITIVTEGDNAHGFRFYDWMASNQVSNLFITTKGNSANGIWLEGTFTNTLTNITLEIEGESRAITIRNEAWANQISNLNVTFKANSSYFLYSRSSGDNYIYNMILNNTESKGNLVYLENYDNVNIIDSIILNEVESNITFEDATAGDFVRFINVTSPTYNANYASGQQGSVEIGWWVDVETIDKNAAALKNVNVSWIDNEAFNNPTSSGWNISLVTGLVPRFYLLQEMINYTNTYNFNNYTLTASKLGFFNNETTINITDNTAINFSLTNSNPEITFIEPTPNNNTVILVNNSLINVSAVAVDINEFKFNWNGTNYSLYNEELVLMLNLDNIKSLGETNTFAHDSSIYENHATISGAQWTQGRYKNALRFNKTNGDYATISDFDYGAEFSLSFWFKTENLSGSIADYIYSHGSVSLSNSLNIYISQTDNAVYPRIRTNLNDGSTLPGIGGIDILDYEYNNTDWHHYALTVTSGNISVYMNGKLRNTTSSGGGSFNPTGNIYLGGRYDQDADRFFGGVLDEVRIWNKTLNADEIRQVYNSNLRKALDTQWYFEINQEPIKKGESTYYAYISTAESENQTDVRTIVFRDRNAPIGNASSWEWNTVGAAVTRVGNATNWEWRTIEPEMTGVDGNATTWRWI